MTTADAPATVIGVGSVLMGDDGVGVHVAALLAAAEAAKTSLLPPDTRVVDGGTLGLNLLGIVREAGVLVLVDAVDRGLAPGSVCVLRGQELDSPGPIGELLDTARLLGWLPERVSMIGIQVGSTGHGPGLTEPVAAALPRAAAIVTTELRALAARAEAAA
jgi:hydrogenase maturation protease